MVPVHDRVVETELDAGLAALLGQLPDDVAAVRRGRSRPSPSPSSRTGRSRRGACVVMTMYFMPGLLGDADPASGVELRRIELPCELLVLVDRDLRLVA